LTLEAIWGVTVAVSSLDDLQWKLIVDRIHEGRCVPFVGAGINVASKERGYEGLLLASGLAEAMAREVGRAGDLARLALEFEMRTDRGRLLEFLASEIADNQVQPSPALQVLARLPFKLVITTNFDRLFERALTLAERDYSALVQPAGGFEDDPQTRERLESLTGYKGTIVYKIHGTFDDDAEVRARYWLDVDSDVTITEDDYIQFLSTHHSEKIRIGVPQAVKALVTPSTLLFLGYSLQDWDFRTIYRGLIGRLEKHQKRRSFAVMSESEQFWADYWKAESITIVDMDVYAFCDELKQRYWDRYPEA